MLFRRLIATLAFSALAALAACGGDSDAGDGDPTGNLFVNPGFEEGAEPWFTLVEEAGFTIVDTHANSGEHSAVLRMDDPPEATGGKVYYLVQEIAPEEFPEVVEGLYRVENWQRGTSLQYVQFVVIAMEPQNFNLTFASNYQIRYILSGIDAPPFEIGNAHFVFLDRDDPPTGEWVPFSANVREDFERLWNAVPEDFEKLRILFEVRWDGKSSGSGAPRADVYYDDLYIGDAR